MEGVEKSNVVGLLPMLSGLFSAANSEASPKLNVLGVSMAAAKLKSDDCFDSSFVLAFGNENRGCCDGAAACANDGDENEGDCPTDVFDSWLVVAAGDVEVKAEVETEVVQEFIELVGGGFQDVVVGRVGGSGGEVGRSHCDVPDEAAW